MECLNVRQPSSLMFQLLRTTLNDKVAGKTPETRKIRKVPILTKDEEDALEE